jgi:RimJ/RimL family protein N-acetyltransferase
MRSRSDWPAAEAIQTQRLVLEPVRVEHAPEMVASLRDPGLYTYTGGRAPDLKELRARYGRQSVGHSPDGTQGWLNWIIRDRSQRTAVGAVQATLHREPTGLSAELAWVIGVAYQGWGYATEAARGMRQWLGASGVERFTAYIHPDHQASAAVARHLGLTATADVRDGEIRWAIPDGRR